jgi:hypothetical protein
MKSRPKQWLLDSEQSTFWFKLTTQKHRMNSERKAMKIKPFLRGRQAPSCQHFLTLVAFAGLLPCVAFAQQPRDSAASSQSHTTQSFHASFVGTCHNKDDFSFTGTPIFNGTSGAIRIYCQIAGHGTAGHFVASDSGEEEVGAPCNALTASLVVLSFDDQQDQLFLRNSAVGTDCAVSANVRNPRVTFVVLGGTGRFEGATGTVTKNAINILLAGSALGGDGFVGAFSGTLEGSIIMK